MTKERLTPPEFEPLPDGFDFSEREQLYDRVSHTRFTRWFADERTTVHKMGVDSNSFGEFLFVTASRPTETGNEVVTFYGLGYHDYRERWITREWFWYRTRLYGEPTEPLTSEEAQAVLDERLEQVQPDMDEDTQSQRGALFELLADLTDDDGAYAEMGDLENWLHRWADDEEEG